MKGVFTIYENEEKSGNKEMSLLEDLFYGGIRPCDSFQPDTPDIRRLTDEKYVIKETTLYSAFTRLEKNGYIESFYGDETEGRRRTYYQITPAGRAYYEEKCEEWRVTREVVEHFIRR